ncbi:MAG TPA: nucleotide disphospho-sugar-binding domain-containing protein [Polyangia bacterium]
MISNGGSTTGYQALASGVPVLGIASNLDQFLAMTAIAASGAGILLRAGSLKEASVRDAVGRMLSEPTFGQSARAVAGDFARHDSAQQFEFQISNLVVCTTDSNSDRAGESRGPVKDARPAYRPMQSATYSNSPHPTIERE